MDIKLPSKRTKNMRAIKSADTRIEIKVRELVERLGFIGTRNDRSIPGKPDLAFEPVRKAIFVHGCFWHRHPGCKYATTPKSNAEFWLQKFEANIARDKRVQRELRRAGWKFLVIWGCQVRDEAALLRRLRRFL